MSTRIKTMKTTSKQRNRLDWLAMESSPLVDMLPHGSGIDDKWDISQLVNHNVVCSCSYHGMNENGYYDGWQDFKIVIHPIDYPTICPQCDGRGYRTLQQIADIRHVDVTTLSRDSFAADWIDESTFVCNSCRDVHNPRILDFQLQLTGYRQRKAWAYGLRDYLGETIDYALSDCLKLRLANVP